MISTSKIDFCLQDIQKPDDVDRIFRLIEQAKSAIQATGCKCLSISYKNQLDICCNPRGDIGSLIFEITSPDNTPRELRVQHFVYLRNDKQCVNSEVVCSRVTEEKKDEK